MNLKTYWQQSIGGIPFNREAVETDTEWGWLKKDRVLYLSFCGSVSKLDWLQNFSFWKVPYKDMPVKWRAHAGFVTKWKSIRDNVLALLALDVVDEIQIRGYSQGAAVALLAHEDMAFHYPMKKVESWLFGCPRVFARRIPGVLIDRCHGVTRVTNGGDIVTGVPPWWMWYIHMGAEIRIGKKKLFRLSVKDHLIKNITEVLETWTET